MGKLKIFKIISGILIILSILFAGSAIYTIYLLTGIETFYRIMFSLLLILVLITLIYSLIDSIKFYKTKKFVISSILTFLITIITVAITVVIYTVYLKLDNMNKTEVTYKTALISLEDGYNIKEIKDIKIGIVEDEEDIEGYILPQDVIKEYKLNENNTIIEYSDTMTLMSALINGEIDAIFISSNYESMFKNIESEELGEIYEIHEYGKDYKKEEVEETEETTKVSVTDPFTILLLGIDSQENGISANSSFNGDTIMLITVDPQTLHATMFSIPRDTYVTMACGGNFTKINHAAWGGTKCMIRTVENFTGIKIDHYVKINFKGVVDLVNTLGGITVDVPMDFCESNSDRLQGEFEICLNKGVQVLNGEQALALARHRKTLALGDFQRGQNQQLVVEGMLNQLKTLRSVNDFYNVLNTISNNIDTSMSTDQILSFYNVGKSILLKDEDVQINITKTFLTGYDLYAYEGSGYSYTFQYYEQSLAAIVKAMKINLGLLEQEIIKEFSFSINNPYEKTIIGYKYYSEPRKELMPDFTTYSKEGAQTWATARGYNLIINEIESDDEAYYNGQIINQSVHAGVLLVKSPKDITIDVVKKVTVDKPDTGEEEGSNTPEPPTEEEPETPSEEPEEPSTTPEEPEEPTNPDETEE